MQDAVAGVLSTGSFARITAPWTRMVLAVRARSATNGAVPRTVTSWTRR
jgi:hypothetical protein